MITEDYVSFETAKLLKEKGFDGECRDYYNTDGHFYSEDFRSNWNDVGGATTIFSAPSLALAMKWLREEKNIISNIWRSNGDDTAWCSQYLGPVPSNPKLKDFFLIGEGYRTYEEACEAAIKYCLENLI